MSDGAPDSKLDDKAMGPRSLVDEVIGSRRPISDNLRWQSWINICMDQVMVILITVRKKEHEDGSWCCRLGMAESRSTCSSFTTLLTFGTQAESCFACTAH